MSTHFCDELPTVAICGTGISTSYRGMHPNFYQDTTSTFAYITCRECRERVYETRLGPPANFGRPPEWSGLKFAGQTKSSAASSNEVAMSDKPINTHEELREFEAAVRVSWIDGFCTTREKDAAITKARAELAAFQRGKSDERAAIIAFLVANIYEQVAADIERGAHLEVKGKPPWADKPACPQCNDGRVIPDGDRVYCDLMCGWSK